MVIFTCHIQRVLDVLIRSANTRDRRQCHSQSPASLPYLYTLLQPFLRLLTKYTTSGIQPVLHIHILFLPTPFKSNARQGTDIPEEVLKAGGSTASVQLLTCGYRPLQLLTLPMRKCRMMGIWRRASWSGGVGESGPQGDKKAVCDENCWLIPRAVRCG
ncbi:hypothetical protein BDR07DRAFT_236010 [Suillus spraguei]|nr:hypothetical protein BDR07DRAFT_236010 [Suillus spraguei]